MKHEEEVQLRLFFEQKLNTMHHVNREITSKYKNMKLKFAEEQMKTGDLSEKLQLVTKEMHALKDSHHQLTLDYKESQTKVSVG